MKFAYVDESGDAGQSDIFVMAGFLVDAYRLRRITADVDSLLQELFALHPRNPIELKTKAFINGRRGWSDVPADDRMEYLRSFCRLAAADGKIFVSSISFEKFQDALTGLGEGAHPSRRNYWHTAAMLVTSLIQKKMQTESNNKGLTVLVMDDNKAGMPALSDAIYQADPWFDGIYQQRKARRGKRVWVDRTDDNRFDQIINTAFAIKSDHSSLVQISDALAYVYRRHLELQTEDDAYDGESVYYEELIGIINGRRQRLGQCPDCEVVNFYRSIEPEGWSP